MATFKKGDSVRLKPTGELASILEVIPNTHVPFWLRWIFKPTYRVNVRRFSGNGYSVKNEILDHTYLRKE